SMDMRIGSIVLQRKPLPAPDPKHLVKAISDAIRREGEQLLNFSETVTQFQRRVLSLRKWHPTEYWPDLSTQTLLMTNYEWLSGSLSDVEHPDDLFEIDLLPLLQKMLTTEQLQRLDELAPAALPLPEGSFIDLDYQPNGAPPKLEIRLQDVLAWTSHPHVDAGEMTVELTLLSPDLHPVAIVSDLGSFWEGEYLLLKEQLKLVFREVEWER
ncbi:MAG: ATP-dependent helicase HrpB, partial [Sphingobacteriales bacterium]